MLVTSSAADTKIYNLAAGRGGGPFDVLPRRKRKRRRGASGAPADAGTNAGEVTLLQEFDFTTSSQCLKVSSDSRYVAATGIYPPEVRVFDVEELGLKFRRGLDYEVVDFLFLGEDYKKLFFLQVQRHIDIHAQGGTYHKLRIPREGRGLCLLPSLASVCVAGSCPEVYLIDLEAGCFLTPWKTASAANNCCFSSSALPILAVGGESGEVECFDHRTAKSVALLDVSPHAGPLSGSAAAAPEVTCGAFSPSGLQMCVGCSSGVCLVYDVRSPRPLYYHTHYNFEEIKHVEWKTAAGGSSGRAADDDPAAAALLLLEQQSFAGRAAAAADGPAAESFLCGSTSSSSSAAGSGCSLSSSSLGEALVASGDAVSIHVWRCSSSSSAAAAADWQSPQQQLLPQHAASSVAAPAAAQVVAHIEAPAALPEDEGAAGGKQTEKIQQQSIARFNNFVFYPGSGLCFTACERKRMGVYFLPALGIAPRWCSFLDSITEELEEGAAVVTSSSSSSSSSAATAGTPYDEYKFLTRQQLEQLGVQELIGTALVKRYMHGYFMDAKLYRKLKETLEPFDYDAYRRERVQQKLQEKRKMRIEIRRKAPKTNVALARRLEETATTLVPRSKKEKKQQEAARQLLTDDRFEKLFTNPDFEIDADQPH